MKHGMGCVVACLDAWMMHWRSLKFQKYSWRLCKCIVMFSLLNNTLSVDALGGWAFPGYVLCNLVVCL